MGGSGAEDLSSTPATQATLVSIKAKTDNIPAQGQALAAASVPVVLTAIQQAALTPPAAITGFALEAGNLATLAAKDFATSAKQDTGNASLSSIDGKLANPLPVSQGTPAATANAWPVKVTDGSNVAAVKAASTAALASDPSSVVALSPNTPLPAGTNALGSLTAVIPGTSATSLGKAENALAADGDTGVAALAVRQDIPVVSTNATGNYNWITTDQQGRVWVNSDVLVNLINQQNNIASALLGEIKLLRTAFQDWSGQTDPRYDSATTIQ